MSFHQDEFHQISNISNTATYMARLYEVIDDLLKYNYINKFYHGMLMKRWEQLDLLFERTQDDFGYERQMKKKGFVVE